jgi:subtilase family serine protease
VNVICDTALSGNDQDNEIKIFVDSTYSIEESNEDNNEEKITIFISSPENENDEKSNIFISETFVIVSSIVIVLIGLVLMQLAPGKIKKPYEKRK